MIIDARIAGIPYQVKVLSFHRQAPWRGSIMSCPSDVDWYGYTEMDYEILDRKGYKAPWLEKNQNARGSMRSIEHRQAISKAHTGRVFSIEARKKMSEAKKGNKNAFGHRLSEESKQKISVAKRGRPRKNPERS